MPIAIILLTRELSPELKNGSGIPVLGNIAVTTPILTKIWNANMEAMPTAISMPILSGAFLAVEIHIYIMNANNSNMKQHPIKPSSSPATENIKSLSETGTSL